ncbi:kinetochore-associated Ndc80 complex subunit ndc80 [Polyrhizophydium stewartii]|uniref:Kinetochore protein NDC80 n=1 Tax=Polyrhizophydium stewartii TaxID=2732419 RepID=A0ABR4N6C4_9FUNG
MSRMSLASGLAPAGAPPGQSGHRMSMLPNPSMRAAPQPAAKGPGVLADGMASLSLGSGAGPRASDVRRSSSIGGAGMGMGVGGMAMMAGMPGMPGGRPSMTGCPSMTGRPSFAGNVTSLKSDPRPIKDKQWQAKAIRDLVSFLASCNCPVPVSEKKLKSPASKDFADIFRFMYKLLEPNHTFKGKLEEELLPLLKTLRYPFADQINKSQLYSIGSPHAWPTFLAILHWMMETINASPAQLALCCQMFANQSDLENTDDPDKKPEKLFYDYVINAYVSFLQGTDDFDSIDQDLMQIFARKNEATIRDVDRLRREQQALEDELAALSHGQVTSGGYATFASIPMLTCVALLFKEEIARITAEKTELQQIIDAQEISPADLDRMNAERDQLALSLQVVSNKLDAANKIVWEKEIALQKKMDQLEKVVQEYNSLAFKLGFIGSRSKDFAHVSQELEIYVQADSLERMTSVDLRGAVKPTLAKLREKYNATVHRAQDDMLGLQETLDQLTWTQTQKEEELLMLTSRINFLNTRYVQEKEHVSMTTAALNEEIEQFERQIQKLKIEANGLLIASQQKAQRVTLEYEELSRQYSEQKEKALSLFVRSLQDVFSMEQHASQSVAELIQIGSAQLQEATDENAFTIASTATLDA